MIRKTATVLAASVALVACGGGHASVSGKFDEVKSARAVKELSHFETKPKTKRVCVSKDKKGRCTSYDNRPDGTKRVKVVDRRGKSAIYCVELDHVKSGDGYNDDVTFEVSYGVYLKYVGKREGAQVKDLKNLGEVNSCKRN